MQVKTSNLMGKVLMRPHLNLKIFWQLVAAGGTRVTFFLLLFTIYGCFNCTSVYQVCVPGAHGGQKSPLGLELQMIVSCYVGARSWIWVLYKSNQCS